MTTRILLLGLLLLASPSWAQEANASGGYITPVGLSFNQSLSQWYFFYSASGSANTTLAFSEAGGSFHPIALPDTNGFYLISDSSSPFTSSLAAANLAAFDSHFNLSDPESSSRLFNDTSTFSLTAGASTPGGELSLPTLYIPGASDEHAFRVGLAQAGSNFVFVVPRASAAGRDNSTYDFQFFLPYSYAGGVTFYVFSIVAAAPAVTGTTSTPMQSLNYHWAYDGATFTISTERDTSVSLSDQLGKSYNAQSGSSGSATLDVPPGRYSLLLQKSGYYDALDSIYLPAAPPPVQNQTPALPPVPQVSVTRSPEGLTVCLEDNCYFQAVSEADSARLLADLSCNGSLCTLVNISPASFVQKHQLRRVLSPSPAAGARAPATLNFTALVDSLGRGLSDRFGAPSGGAPSSGMMALTLVGLVGLAAAVFFISKAWIFRPRSPGGGYG